MGSPTVSLGRAVRQIREEQEVSRATLAPLVGVSEDAIAEIESGCADPSYELLQKIADRLGVPLVIIVSRAQGGARRGRRAEPTLKLSARALEHVEAAGVDPSDPKGIYAVAERQYARGESMNGHLPERRHLEMLRLRLIGGLTFDEIGKRHGVGKSRVPQILNTYFGVHGVPPAAKARPRKRHSKATTQGNPDTTAEEWK